MRDLNVRITSYILMCIYIDIKNNNNKTNY